MNDYSTLVDVVTVICHNSLMMLVLT